MPTRRSKSSAIASQFSTVPKWSARTELVGVQFSLRPQKSAQLFSQYSIGLHAWLLHQVQAMDKELSARMHDRQSDKPFSLSGLDSKFVSTGQKLTVEVNHTYAWQVSALSKPVVKWLAQWLPNCPSQLSLGDVPFSIEAVDMVLPPTTYRQLQSQVDIGGAIDLSFLSPTSFRRKGNHFPLPIPVNVFHSYLRRWNHFSGEPIEPEDFLSWVEESVVIAKMQLDTAQVSAGKRGTVTGFMGAVRFAITKQGRSHPKFVPLFYSLCAFAPYGGTGHKTTFGLGQTALGWMPEPRLPQPPQDQLAERISELTALFLAQRKRTGGTRAMAIAQTQATIMARREMGESLKAIAADLDLKYETARTYSKLARKQAKL
jgi:CRISPR-associated endoribonuclease Cas6